MYNPLVISNFFISKSLDSGEEVTPMKLIKLVYISHGWYLGFKEEPLISEAVLAWEYGPVVKNVYDSFKHYGRSPVTSLLDFIEDGVINKNEMTPEEGGDAEKLLEAVWNNYKSYNGLELSTLTHQTGTPWERAINEYGINSIIPNNYIKEHYKSKIETNKKKAEEKTS